MPDGTFQTDVTQLRLHLLVQGYAPIPIKSWDHPSFKDAGKAPLLPKWQNVSAATLTPDTIRAWAERRHENNTGLVCGELIVVDIDTPVPRVAERIKATAFDILGPTPFLRIGRAPKLALCYRVAVPIQKMLTPELFLHDGTKLQVEILAKGQQVVAFGTHPDTKRPYEWPQASPVTHAFTEVPETTPEALAAFTAEAEGVLRASGALPRVKDPKPAGSRQASQERRSTTNLSRDFPPPTREAVADALRCIPNTHDWHGWVKIGAAIYDALADDGEALFLAWSARSSKDDSAATKAKWASFKTSPMNVTAGSLFWEAQQNGWKSERERRTENDDTRPGDPAAATASSSDAELELTEHGVALAFAKRHGSTLRYCHTAGTWFIWTRTHWAKNATRLAFTWARNLVAELNRGQEMKVRAITGKAAFASAVERFAQADTPFAVTAASWDRDPWQLGTPGGTVDLRTGVLREARREDLISRVTAIAPARTAACPEFLAFLHQTVGGDVDLVAFLQRWFGYCLTGDTREHALLFGYGPGGNGKSVLLNTVSRILGSYHKTAAMDVLADMKGSQHKAFIAMLNGARLVTAAETEEGRAWAETRVKELTGGTEVTANFMRCDPFSFVPQFKIVVTGNHKPILKNVDEAMRRRLNIVPFVHRPTHPDRQLEAKLEAEWPGILRWMIDGCLSWQRDGLQRPKAVMDATAEYFAAQDYFGRWLSECCVVGSSLSSKPGLLLASFKQWCDQNGEPVSDTRRLRSMIERTPGLRYVTLNGTQLVRGLGLRPVGFAHSEGGGVEGSGGNSG